MPTEIEMKAWVADEAGLRARLQERCQFVRSFVKEDTYWRMPHNDDHPQSPKRPPHFRLRIDGDHALCTLKHKRMKAGLEINREIEFAVGDAGAFREFAAALGCRHKIDKRKVGDLYRYDDLTVELVRVEGLGLFLEVEQLLENPTPQQCRLSEKAIRAFFSTMQLPSEAIEPRRYIDMLTERRAAAVTTPTLSPGSS